MVLYPPRAIPDALVEADPTEAKVKAAVSPLPPSSSTNGAAESPIGDPERTAITTGTSNTHREYPRSYGHLGYNYDLVIGGTLSSSKQAKRPAQERGMKRKAQLQDK